MSETVRLSTVAKYSSKRIKAENVSLDNFVTTDNILQNKAGITTANNLPPSESAMPAYEIENILVANIRPYLKKIWFANKTGGCSADVLVFEINKDYFPKFVYYSMFRDDFFEHTMRGVKGTKMPRGDKNQIMEFLIPDFDFPTQQKIASVLSALDSKIELNNRINAELEAMAKTLYDYWFVQFDFPDARGLPYKSSGGKMVWNEELKREIPDDWEVKKIGEVATVKAGGDKPEYFSFEKTETCSIPIFSNGITNDGLYGYTNKTTIIRQSITISARGTIGFSILRNKPFVPIIRLIVITPIHLGCAIFLDQFIKTIKFEKSGSVQQQLTVPQVSQLNVLYPPTDILKRFEAVTSPFISESEILKEQNKQLAELRDWLLPMLMNGQVSVR